MEGKDILEYRKYLNKLLVIKNSITLICFTILAIFFNKWWIVLFSILCFSNLGKDEEDK